MKIKKALIAITTSVLLATSIAPTFSVNQSVQAANYSKSEAAQVRKFQTEYKQLNQQTYNQNNLYVKAPNFADPFDPGQLDADYIQTSMDYVNYYRALAGLPNEANNKTINDDAQIGAGVLAAVNAKTSLRAHGLLGYKKPKYISNKDWNTAKSATLGNINFLSPAIDTEPLFSVTGFVLFIHNSIFNNKIFEKWQCKLNVATFRRNYHLII